MTGRNLIQQAMRLIGALAPGETATAAEADDGLTILNRMIDAWAAQSLAIYVVVRATQALTSGTQTYTLGSGGTWNRARPVHIQAASVITNTTPATELPIDLLLDAGRWQRVAIKSTTGALPTQVYVDGAFPRRNVSYSPIPDVSGLTGVLYLPVALTSFADLSTDYTFPPGYEEALYYQLALRLAPEFGKPIDGGLAQLALDAFGVVKRANLPMTELRVDDALLTRANRWNYRTGP